MSGRESESSAGPGRAEGMPAAGSQPVLIVEAVTNNPAATSDLRRLWDIFLRYRLVFLFVTVPVVGLALLYALTTKPTYRAEVLLAPAAEELEAGGLSALAGQFGGLASLAGMGSFGSADKVRALAVLKSRAFTEDFISSNNLVPVLFEDDWDESAGAWKFDDADDVPTMRDAFEKFDRDVRRVIEERDTGLVRLTIDWHDRHKAAAWANELVARLNDRMRAMAIDEATRSIDYLNTELSGNSVVGVRQGIYKIIEKQVETAMLANVNKEFAFKVIDPAVATDADKYVWPKKLVILVVAFVFAVLLAAFLCLLINAFFGTRQGGREI